MNKPTPHEVEIGRLTKKLNKMKDQRDKARKDLEHYRKVISMQPYLENRHKSYEARIAERKRVKDLEKRVEEQAMLIALMNTPSVEDDIQEWIKVNKWDVRA